MFDRALCVFGGMAIGGALSILLPSQIVAIGGLVAFIVTGLLLPRPRV